MVFGFITLDDLAWMRSVLHNKELTDMASGGKKKTTMAKLTRESRLRERRLDKQAKKEARKLAPAHHSELPGEMVDATTAVGAPNQMLSASGNPVSVPSPTHAT